MIFPSLLQQLFQPPLALFHEALVLSEEVFLEDPPEEHLYKRVNDHISYHGLAYCP